MSLFINKEFNSIVFTPKDFKINFNYIPDLFMALNELNNNKEVHIAITLDKTPALFLMFFNKILKESPNILHIYQKDTSEATKFMTKSYGIKYKNTSEYPFGLPQEDNEE
jgi:predicted glycosyl hydrolase (DUF1957 family)